MRIKLIFACALLSSLSSFAQPKTIKIAELDDALSPAIVVNPRNPLSLTVLGGERSFTSIDGGKTWEQKKIASAHGIYGDQFLVSDSKGTLYLFHLSGTSSEGLKDETALNSIICRVSDDGGKSWDDGSPVWMNEGKDQINPAATVDAKGNIYLSWTEVDKFGSNKPECKSTILLSSSGNGRKWSKPVQIPKEGGGCQGDGQPVPTAFPATANEKKVYVAWLNKDKIFMDRSFDGGGMWLSNDIEVTQQKEGFNANATELTRPNGLPILMADRSKTNRNGLLYMVYADQRLSGNPEVWFIRSNDFGDHWISPVRVGDALENRRLFSPWMAIDKITGTIYISYYSQALDSGETDVYLAYSKDAGNTFKNVKLTDQSFQISTTTRLSLCVSAYDAGVATVWVSPEDGKFALRTSSISEKDLH